MLQTLLRRKRNQEEMSDEHRVHHRKKNFLEVFFILALFSIQYVLFRKEQ